MGTVATTTKATHAAASGSVKRVPQRAGTGPDRLTVVLVALAGFLAVLALLAWQLPASAAHTSVRPVIVLRRVYRTTIVETIARASDSNRGAGATAVTQSVSSSGSANAPAPAPTTRSS